jgi:hypothetical protein
MFLDVHGVFSAANYLVHNLVAIIRGTSGEEQ